MRLFWKLDLVGLLVAAGLPAAAYWTQVQPTMQRNRVAAATIQQLQKQRSTQADLQRTLAVLGGSSKTTPATTPSLVTLQPLSELNRRLASLNDLAATHSLTIDTLEPVEPVIRDRYSATVINLSAQGTYRACQSWMSDLHQALPDVSVVQWQLASLTSDTVPQVKLTATLRWYALPKAGNH